MRHSASTRRTLGRIGFFWFGVLGVGAGTFVFQMNQVAATYGPIGNIFFFGVSFALLGGVLGYFFPGFIRSVFDPKIDERKEGLRYIVLRGSLLTTFAVVVASKYFFATCAGMEQIFVILVAAIALMYLSFARAKLLEKRPSELKFKQLLASDILFGLSFLLYPALGGNNVGIWPCTFHASSQLVNIAAVASFTLFVASVTLSLFSVTKTGAPH